MSKQNLELLRLLWPKDSLRRVLTRDFPGCKTALEAFQKIVSEKKPVGEHKARSLTKLKTEGHPTPLENILRNAILEVERFQKDIDPTLILQKTRDDLALMPLETEEEIILWRDAWIREINSWRW